MRPSLEEMASEYRPFWVAAAAGELRFPRCDDCGKFHWYPMKVCPHCQSDRIDWKKISGQGSLYSWTTVRRAFVREFEAKLPYVVGLIEFPEAPGVRLISNLVDIANAEQIAFGAPMVPVFDKMVDERSTLAFKPK